MSRREPPPAGLLALVAVVVALVGCGGATKHPQARHLSVRAGLSVPQYASAGSSDDYKPTGRIIADNGFRPPGEFDLAVNIHSFSECPLAAIEWWMSLLARLRVPRLFLVPNERTGFLSTEADGTRKDYLPVIDAAGYSSVAEEWAFDDPAVRKAIGIDDRFCLFELRP